MRRDARRTVRQREPGRKVPMGAGPRGPGPGGQGRAGARAAEDLPDAQVVASPGDYRFHVGDPLLEVGVALHEGGGLVRSVGLHALAKAPLADVASGVGTGEWDYGAGVALGLGGTRAFLLANASYWVVGDLPDLPLRNTLSYAVSVGRTIRDGRLSVVGSVLGATSVIETADAPVSVGPGLGYNSWNAHGFDLGVSVGLTEAAPDVATFAGWRLALGRGMR